MNRSATLVGISGLALAASSALATNYTVNWLDQSPVPVGNSVPNASSYLLPGVGPVTVTYATTGTFSDARVVVAGLSNGNVTFGPDNYAWTNHEVFGVTNLVSTNPVQTAFFRVTYTFATPQPANSLVVGVMGLGATTSFGGGNSSAFVPNNGTFLGDWSGGNPFGATNYTGGVGNFIMQNSVTGAGGANPHWNSQLGVVLINDAVSSITIELAVLSGDGVGVNIGSVIPAPSAAAIFGGVGVLALQRRRR
jgi:hypothetical protein